MPLELYLAYLAAAAVVLVIPGPTITLVVGYALAEGRRAAWATVAGVALGDLTAVTLSSPVSARFSPPRLPSSRR